jgi:hypothetical protein
MWQFIKDQIVSRLIYVIIGILIIFVGLVSPDACGDAIRNAGRDA